MTHKEYNTTAKGLHWLMALGIFAATLLAFRMTSMAGITPLKIKLFNYHKWLGVVLWGLIFVRLLWRFLYPPPAHTGTSVQIKLIAAGHWCLYALMIAVPSLGYFYSLVAGFPVVLFGVLPLPQIMSADPELKPVLQILHHYAGYSLAFLALGHAGMACFHHVIKKDDTLKKMLPTKHT